MKWVGFALALVVAIWAIWYFGVLAAAERLIDDWMSIVTAR